MQCLGDMKNPKELKLALERVGAGKVSKGSQQGGGILGGEGGVR